MSRLTQPDQGQYRQISRTRYRTENAARGTHPVTAIPLNETTDYDHYTDARSPHLTLEYARSWHTFITHVFRAKPVKLYDHCPHCEATHLALHKGDNTFPIYINGESFGAAYIVKIAGFASGKVIVLLGGGTFNFTGGSAHVEVPRHLIKLSWWDSVKYRIRQPLIVGNVNPFKARDANVDDF